jgi:hypothetical protein
MRRLWLPVTLGFVLGVVAGLYYAWTINPVNYVDTAPASLRRDFKSQYVALIASAYIATGDLERATARLGLFPESGNPQALAALAQEWLGPGHPPSEARALVLLAADLGGAPLAQPATPARRIPPSPAATAAAQSTNTAPSLTPTLRQPTPPPSATPTPTPAAAFRLLSREEICDPRLTDPLIQVLTQDSSGAPLPGIRVDVLWDAGEDSFYTGLKPELGAGYGDFAISVGVTYALQVFPSGVVIRDLQSGDCFSPAGEPFPSSWRLIFQQPAAP